MKLLVFLLRGSWWRAAAVLCSGMASGALSAALIAVVNQALALPSAERGALAWKFLGLALGFPLAWLVSQLLIVGLGQQAILVLRNELSRRVLEAPLRRIEEIGSHRILAALTEDLLHIANFVAAFPNLIVSLATLLGCLAYLAWLSPAHFLPFCAFLVLIVVGYRRAFSSGRDRVRKARSRNDELFRLYRGLVGGVKELKLHEGRRAAFLGQLNATAETLRDFTISSTRIFHTAGAWGRSLFFLQIAFLFFVLPRWIEIGTAELSAYTLTLLYLRTPLQNLIDLFPQMSRVKVALERVQGLGVSLQPETPASRLPADALSPWRRLDLAGVTHAYGGSDHPFVLGPVDLTLTNGETVFLVGGNGSGKTTLAKLLVGLYTPETGEIRLDGRRIGEQDLDGYRRYFTAVFSDFHLFERLLGMHGDRLDEKAREYLGKLELEHKLTVENGSFSTTELSQGQRKRLALLVAYLEDRPIYLFDEWAADQDPAFKEVFYLELLPELKERGKTVVVISHDDQYYRLADRIIKLDYGRIESDTLAASRTAGALTRSAVP